MKVIKINKTNFREVIGSSLDRKKNLFNEIDKSVSEIINNVREKGDKALFYYTKEYDRVELESLRVGEKQIEEAFREVGDEFIKILKDAKRNIEKYHQRQVQNSWMTYKENGIMLGQKITPIERVGVYVPGGKAAYPSTVLMNVIPAKLAGVESIVLVSPPDRRGKVNTCVLAAAHLCGIDEIYSIGGAQAVGALAYGTETIAPVYKIAGPGNIYVARAKKMVYGDVDIDMIAGPSEICIIADETSNPAFIAADMLSQAEHDELASSILITDSESLVQRVAEELKLQMDSLNRKDIIQKSIENQCRIYISDDIKTAVNAVNEIAPEHLELMTESPFEILPYIKNAGAIFLGKYSPEPLGDYFAGPNHTLPTSGTAKFSSPLGVDSFIKKSSIIFYNEDELKKAKDSIIKFAEKEGLDAHSNSIRMRFKP